MHIGTLACCLTQSRFSVNASDWGKQVHLSVACPWLFQESSLTFQRKRGWSMDGNSSCSFKTLAPAFFASSVVLKVYKEGLFLVVRWLRICPAMQGTWVQSFVRELRSHTPWNNQTCVLQLKSPRTTARESTVIVDWPLSRVRLFVTSWTAAHQDSLSFTISWSCSNSCPWSQ